MRVSEGGRSRYAGLGFAVQNRRLRHVALVTSAAGTPARKAGPSKVGCTDQQNPGGLPGPGEKASLDARARGHMLKWTGGRMAAWPPLG